MVVISSSDLTGNFASNLTVGLRGSASRRGWTTTSPSPSALSASAPQSPSGYPPPRPLPPLTWPKSGSCRRKSAPWCAPPFRREAREVVVGPRRGTSSSFPLAHPHLPPAVHTSIRVQLSECRTLAHSYNFRQLPNSCWPLVLLAM
jgi:hypothetical protein